MNRRLSPGSLLLFLALFCLPCPSVSAALEAGGVEISGHAVVGGKELVLNGAGLRKKFFIKVYAGALYLPDKARSAEEALFMPGPRRVLMHFIHSEVSKEKLISAWREGFLNNLSTSQYKAIEKRMEAFCSLFSYDAHEGDEYLMDYIPGNGVTVALNGKALGTVEGEDFMRALLLIWLGDKPADASLKKAMLGG